MQENKSLSRIKTPARILEFGNITKNLTKYLRNSLFYSLNFLFMMYPGRISKHQLKLDIESLLHLSVFRGYYVNLDRLVDWTYRGLINR